jgi:glycosyltransferase involved in cell wall biosynthesis|tara:strand:+ start:809 stop:1828 length:1020 start_codon:yes stop_codon:yes gene_type:complete
LASKHQINIVEGADTGWRRSLLISPDRFAEAIVESPDHVDALVASTPIDLATVLGLLPSGIPRPPTLLYMHESQIGYPPGPKGGRANGGIVNDWRSILVADRVAVATRFHESILVKKMPPFAEQLIEGAGSKLESKLSSVELLPIGIDTSRLAPVTVTGPIKIMWNHRWSYDKGPGEFAHAVSVLAGEGHDFSVYALGEVERSGQQAYERLLNQLSDRVVLRGYQQEDAYLHALCRSDLVVSSAQHDFFGLAVAEAIAAGARPLLPERLAYPEIVPETLQPTLLYKVGLLEALRSVLTTPRELVHQYRSATMAHVSAFDWSKLAPKYDDLIDDMVTAQS